MPRGFHHFLYRAFDDLAELGGLLSSAFIIFCLATPIILLTGAPVLGLLDAGARHAHYPAMIGALYACHRIGQTDAPTEVKRRRYWIVWSVCAVLVVLAGSNA